MRIKPSSSFPHPVLSADTGDFLRGDFKIELSVQEEPELGRAVLIGAMSLDDPSMMALLKSGSAISGLMITCLETYLDEFHRCPVGDVRVDLSGGKVRGQVFVRGVVVAAADNIFMDSDSIDSEFPRDARIVQSGEVIALTPELRFEAGLEKLAALESVFHLKQHEDVAEGVFKVDLDGESIDILVAPELHRFLSLLRQRKLKDTLLSSLFLPVVMIVLDAMRCDDFHAEKRWYGV
ncbi:MAG: hypothetical protein ACTHOH_01220, partial [Lysobacteraceae bacterium]